MKTILCLTDFSVNSENAAKTAAYLASKLKTNLFLFNSCITTPVIPSYGGGPWIVDEIAERELLGIDKIRILKMRLTDLVSQFDQKDYRPTIHTECGEGRLGINIDEIIAERSVELIVMGAQNSNRADDFLSGSETKDVINHASRPILLIPEHIELKKIKNVIFATDYSEEDLRALTYLSDLGLKLQFHIELVHVDVFNEKPIVPFERNIFLSNVLNAGYSNVSFKEIKGKELVKRLTAFSEESRIELLAVMHHQHSFFTRFFQHSVTKRLLMHQCTPLLVFPSKMHN